MLALLVLLLSGPLAQDELDPTGMPDASRLLEDEDDFEFDAPPPTTEPSGPPALALDAAGKDPLQGGFPLVVVAAQPDAVVVELPVLVARTRAGTEAGFLLVGEARVGGRAVAEVRHVVTADSLAVASPTFAFLKLTVPVEATRGEVEVVVKTAALDGTEARELFRERATYRID